MVEEPRTAVITGASGGIASTIARRLARDGWNLVLVSRSGCVDIAAETGQPALAGSVLNDEDMQAAVEMALDRFGRVDSAVFSGGRQSDILREFDVPKQPRPTAQSFVYDGEYAPELFDIPFDA